MEKISAGVSISVNHTVKRTESKPVCRHAWFFLFFLCLSAVHVFGANRFAVASGNWNGSIWATTAGGVAGSAATPGTADAVTINASVVIAVNVAATATSVIVNGTLNLNSTFDVTLTNAGSLTVNSGGTLSFSSGGQILGGANTTNGITVTINSGATLSTANTIGFMAGVNNTVLTGSIAINRGSKTGPTYSTGADYIFNAVAAQNTGTGITGANDLTVSTTGGALTASANLTVGGIVTIDLSSTFSLAATTLTLSAGGTPLVNNGTLTPGTSTVTYSGTTAQNIDGSTYNNLTFSGAGTKNIASGDNVSVAGNWTTGSAAITLTGTANVNVTGNITGTAPITMGSGTLTAGGATTNAFANSGTFTPGTGTVVYNRAAAQTVRQTTYNNLTLGGSNAKTTTTVTVNGILSMEGTATASAAPAYGANATLQYNTTSTKTTGPEWPATFTASTLSGGVVIENTGDITLNAAKTLGLGMPLTINSGAVLNMSTFLVTLNDDFINNGGTLSGTTGGVTITGNAAQNIGAFVTTGNVSSTKSGGTATFTGNISGGGLVINNTSTGILDLGTGLSHTFTTFTRTAGTLQGNTGTLNISGAITNTAGTFTANTSTVNFTGAAGQTIPPLTYYNLGFSGAGIKTIATATAVTVGNDWAVGSATTMTGSAGADVAGDITGSGVITMNTGTISIAGNWTNNGAFVSGTGTVIYDGAVQSIAPLSYNNLQTSSAGIKTLSGATTVKAILTVNSPSELDLAAVTLTLSGSGTPLVNNGTFTPSTSTVNYTNAGATTIAAVDYNNLNGTGGNRTLSSVVNIRIAGTFTPGAGTYTVTNSTVDFNGTGNQNIPAFTFNKLIVSNAGIKKILAAIVVACQTIDINDNASVEIDADGAGKLNVLE